MKVAKYENSSQFGDLSFVKTAYYNDQVYITIAY